MSVCNFYSLTPEQLLTPLIYSQSGILTGWKHDSWLAADHKKSRTAAQLREVGVEVGWVASLQKMLLILAGRSELVQNILHNLKYLQINKKKTIFYFNLISAPQLD